MSYKNQKELKDAQKKWNNVRLQQRNPAGYKQHLSNVKAFNDAKKGSKNDDVKISDKKGGKKGGKKWSFSKKEERAHSENIQATEREAKRLETYKPKTIKGVKRENYKGNMKDMPKRPNVPKLPKIDLPGGRLGSRNIKKPSGRPGTIKDYNTSRINLDSVYTAHLKKQSKK